MSRKVFIPSIPTRWDAATEQRVPSVDLNPAARYGELVAMSNGTGSLQDQIDDVLKKADEVQEDDYILCVGEVVLIAAAIAEVSSVNGGINLLRWDKNERKYKTEWVEL